MMLEKRRPAERILQCAIQDIQQIISLSLSESGGEQLSKREYEILCNMLQGFSNKEIAQELKISEKTVKNHLCKIYRKFNVKNRTQLFHQLLLVCPCIKL